ncbi:hypothetical protein OKW21_000997 [Catalinimonas alkaloidigena]|nr:hypothetical protein [Catalinimonas alkaloidigena]
MIRIGWAAILYQQQLLDKLSKLKLSIQVFYLTKV